MTTPTLYPPTWPGGPSICTVTMMPAFETRLDFDRFYKRNCPGCKVVREGRCQHCGYLHFKMVPRDPSGDSSGVGRSVKSARHKTN